VEPRKEAKPPLKAPAAPKKGPNPRLRIVRLEERIAPKLAVNHNETLVRDRPAKAR
jgi:hypothetical protein